MQHLAGPLGAHVLGGFGNCLRGDCHLAHELARRGVSTLMVDHPGVGEALRLRGLPGFAESERFGSACVDYLETRSDVELSRIGVMGWWLGDYAPRAAA